MSFHSTSIDARDERRTVKKKEKKRPPWKTLIRSLLVTSKYVDLDFFRKVFADVYIPSKDLP